MRQITLAVAIMLVNFAGCSNLVVQKVSVDQRLANCDQHVDGFRYYLSRPYVLVLEAIPLTSTKVLVALKENGELTFVDGANAGKMSSLDALRQENGGSPVVTAVLPEEWARMRSVIQTAPPKDEVVPVQHIASQNIVIEDQGGVLAAGDPGTTTPAKSDTTKPATTQTASGRKSAQLNGSIQIVFLPDMDEQYAVRSKNCLSKSEFSLQFRNGWELTDVSGNHDSTPVALELFKTIDTAIDVAKTLSTASTAKLPTSPGTTKAEGSDADRKATNYYYLTRTTALKPGMYRLNKPWEMEGELPTGCGFLAKLGLESFTTLELTPITQAVPQEVIKGTVKSIDAKNLVVVLSDKSERTFSIPAKLLIDVDGNKLAPGAAAPLVKAGAEVTVTAQGNNAVRIVVVMAKKSEK